MEEHTQVTMLGETFLDDITNDVNNSDLELQQIVPYGRYLDVEDEIVPHNNKQDDCPHITHHDATTTAVSLMLDPAPASDSMNPSPAHSSTPPPILFLYPDPSHPNHHPPALEYP